MTQSFVKTPGNGLQVAHSALGGLGVLSAERAPSYKLFHVDDCMYVAATDETQARAHVKAECGNECGEVATEASLDMKVTTANVDDGEKATPATMTTARALIEDELKHGGKIPHTVCFDNGL